MGTFASFVVAVVITTSAAGQVTDRSIYSGAKVADLGITIASWGGGTIKESNDVSIAGGNSLLVRTSTFYEGGLIKFSEPIDLDEISKNKENLLQVSIWVVENKTSAGGGGRGGAMAGGGGGALSGGGGAVGAGGGLGTGGATGPAAQMENLRIVIMTSDGKLSEAVFPLRTLSGSTGKWRRIGIPLNAIPGFAGTNRQVVAIMTAGDAPASFYLGELRVVTDQTPIQGYLPYTEMNLARGDEVVLSASAQGGYSILEFAWDFDDRDGIQDDAIGQAIFHRFRLSSLDPKYEEQGQVYTVTLTIRDIHGLKKPWVGTIKVTVN